MTAKEKIFAALRKLPDDATYEKVIEQICLLEAVDEGLRQLDAGEGIPDESIDWDALANGRSR
ncbi:MAG: hypothetical protein QM811_30675 [Pirellulales bacterium]